MFTEVNSLVIDNGSYMTKAGFSGCDYPELVFRSIVGVPKNFENGIFGSYQNSFYVGDSFQLKEEIMNLKYPIKHRINYDWSDMEKIWNYTFSEELEVKPKEHPILLTEALFNSQQNKEKIKEIMFETFEFPALFFGNQLVLSLFSTGRVTGVVLDCGDTITESLSISEGHGNYDTAFTTYSNGIDLPNYMHDLLYEKHCGLIPNYGRNILRDVIEKLCFVSQNFNKEMSKDSQQPESFYELPDGGIISIGKEQFKCPEALFQPSYVCQQTSGIHEILNNSIISNEVDIRNDMYKNVVLCGGNSMFRGMEKRLQRELIGLAPSNSQVNVVAPWYRKYLAWIGGSIFASLSCFNSFSTTRQQYEENGASYDTSFI